MATETILCTCPIFVPTANTTLFIQAAAKQSYSSTSGSLPWQLSIYQDGVLLNYVGGATAYTDSPVVFGLTSGLSAGNHTFTLGWYGASQIQILGVNMMVQQAAK